MEGAPYPIYVFSLRK